MSSEPITKYRAAWHQKNRTGAIVVSNSKRLAEEMTFDADSAAEFLAVLQILQGDDDPYWEDGWIRTGKEQPGGDKS